MRGHRRAVYHHCQLSDPQRSIGGRVFQEVLREIVFDTAIRCNFFLVAKLVKKFEASCTRRGNCDLLNSKRFEVSDFIIDYFLEFSDDVIIELVDFGEVLRAVLIW